MIATGAADFAAKFKTVLGHFPTGVAIVTGAGRDGPVGLTVQSFMSVSLDPPLVLLSIDRRSTRWPQIAASENGLAINVLSESQRDLALTFARGSDCSFDDIEWTRGELTGAPILAGIQAWLECKVWRTYDGGDHEIAVASVLDLCAGADETAHPLIFLRSRFPKLDSAHWRALTNQ